MIKKSLVFYIFSIILGFSILVFIPISIISSNLSTYGKIEDGFSFTYAPNLPASSQELRLNVDVGDIEVRYVYPPVNYVMKIEMDLNMVGVDLSGKSFSDIFAISQQNTSSSLNLTMLLKTKSWFDQSLVILQNLKIIVYLNADFMHNIYCNVNYEGNFDLQVPWDITVNNLYANITKGNIFLDFGSCILAGNITGYINHEGGSIELKVYNIKLIQNSNWFLTNMDGNIKYNITQEIEMGANVTSIGKTDLGIISVIYVDNSPEVGAIFYFHATNNHEGVWEGFNDDSEIDEGKWWLSRFIYDSYDFPTTSNFNISLFRNFYGEDYTFNLLNM